MLEFTNKSNLSAGLLKAISYSKYNKGDADFSATELITPSRIVALSRRHSSAIKEDASDVIYRMFGSIGHAIAERAKLSAIGNNSEKRSEAIEVVINNYLNGGINKDAFFDSLKDALDEADSKELEQKHGLIFERRFYATIDIGGKEYKISGQLDEYDKNINLINDYKICSRWVALDGGKEDWDKQLNIYAWILRRNGFNPEHAQVEAIFRDWSKSQALRDKKYPQSQVLTVPIALWSDEETTKYIESRIVSHLLAITELNEKNIKVCTPEERWERGFSYAVMKHDRKRAIKLFDSKNDAQIWINNNEKQGEHLYIENRKGESIRCKMYCPVSEFCSYRKLFE